jgi:hypothetical protein
VSAEPSAGVAAARATRLAVALLAALAIALVVTTLSGSGSTTAGGGRLGGDFPEFYGAGLIVRAGDADELYDAERQEASQEGLFGDDDTGYLDFAYPPVVAAVYAPLTFLSYRVAYLVQVLVLVALVVLALRLVAPMVPYVAQHRVVVLAGTIACYPMFRSVGAAQNTALTVLCLVGAWRALHDDREVLAGAWLGALLFKPQLAVLALLALVVTRRWRALGGAAAVGVGLWLASAAVMGPGWLGPFLRHGASVPGNDGSVGGGGSVSLVGTAQRFGEGVEGPLVVVATIGSLVVAGLCLVAWRRCDRDGDIGLGMAILAAGTVLAAPHVIFYDAGLLVVAGLVALREEAPMASRWVVGIGLATWLGALDGLAVNPLAPIAAVVLAVGLHRALRDLGSHPLAEA